MGERAGGGGLAHHCWSSFLSTVGGVSWAAAGYGVQGLAIRVLLEVSELVLGELALGFAHDGWREMGALAERGAYIGLRLYTILSTSARPLCRRQDSACYGLQIHTDPFRSPPTIQMCYSSGSIDQALNPCPMCKVYPHTKCVTALPIARRLTRTRCPHIRKTCTNRGAHPRMDVLYLTNAEGLSSLVRIKRH